MGPSREAPPPPAGPAARFRKALRPAWTRLAARVPALSALRETLAPREAPAPPRPIPRAAIHAAFAAMLEPAWKALDTPPATPREPSASPSN